MPSSNLSIVKSNFGLEKTIFKPRSTDSINCVSMWAGELVELSLVFQLVLRLLHAHPALLGETVRLAKA